MVECDIPGYIMIIEKDIKRDKWRKKYEICRDFSRKNLVSIQSYYSKARNDHFNSIQLKTKELTKI